MLAALSQTIRGGLIHTLVEDEFTGVAADGKRV
jgi:hypothetical protein